jgi:hypothetical protein
VPALNADITNNSRNKHPHPRAITRERADAGRSAAHIAKGFSNRSETGRGAPRFLSQTRGNNSASLASEA